MTPRAKAISAILGATYPTAKNRKGESDAMPLSFRHSAGFGKRIEYYVIGLMLKEGLDVYVPLVDDNAVDAIVRKSDGTFIEIQIKARGNDIKMGDGALFAAIPHEPRENYYFIFYSERLQCMWIMSSEEYLHECVTNKTGKNVGKTSIWFNGTKTDKLTREKYEYPKERYNKYLAKDMIVTSRLTV